MLDGVGVSVHEKLEKTTTHLMNKIQTTVKESGQDGMSDIEAQVALVKELLDGLAGKVNDMNEKMYDFEQNKRNNLIFYGIGNDPDETSHSLAVKMTGVIRSVIGGCSAVQYKVQCTVQCSVVYTIWC